MPPVGFRLTHLYYFDLLIRLLTVRGRTAKVEITGIKVSDGICDNQEVVNRILGLDYVLWRTCVSLGQGTVALGWAGELK